MLEDSPVCRQLGYATLFFITPQCQSTTTHYGSPIHIISITMARELESAQVTTHWYYFCPMRTCEASQVPFHLVSFTIIKTEVVFYFTGWFALTNPLILKKNNCKSIWQLRGNCV
jgi:hypothetical protein